MAPAAGLVLADAGNKFEDLSGVEIKEGDNPYDALINACHGSPVSGILFFMVAGRRGIGKGCGKGEGEPVLGRKGKYKKKKQRFSGRTGPGLQQCGGRRRSMEEQEMRAGRHSTIGAGLPGW